MLPAGHSLLPGRGSPCCEACPPLLEEVAVREEELFIIIMVGKADVGKGGKSGGGGEGS